MSITQILILVSQLSAVRAALVESDVLPPWITLVDTATTVSTLAEKLRDVIDGYDK